MSNFAYLNTRRIRTGLFASDDSFGFTGAFAIIGPGGEKLKIVASDGEGWQHVSVSLMDHPNRVPRWEVMCFVKELFWEDEEEAFQFHPKKSEYVNCHPGCLHLWRPIGGPSIPLPPAIMVGPRK